MTLSNHSPTALVTGASRGFGHALTATLVRRGWHVVVNARDADRLSRSVAALPQPAAVTAIPGDVVDHEHRLELARAVATRGRLDLLVHNASVLGPSPLLPLADHPLPELLEVFKVNALAPIALTQLVLAALRATRGRVAHVSSDAAVEAYEGWGAYGAAKAALDHAARVLAVEEPDVRSWSFDPGDMRTELHALAEPGVDLSNLPLPEDVVPALLRLLDEDLPSGRYTAAALTSALSS
ncbi:MAG: SDR family oxidoreductase [Actinomycetota bacterium]|nr:SDR family oxidoreductase [Actinomycetota bacterium]